MNRDKTIAAVIGGNANKIKTEAAWQYDHGLWLWLKDVEDGTEQQVHFTNTDLLEAICMLPAEDEQGVVVPIPDELLQDEKEILAYVYMEDETSGLTVKQITIPVNPRARPTELTLESSQMGPVNQLSQELREQIDEVNTTASRVTEMGETLETITNDAETVLMQMEGMTVSAVGLEAGSEPTVQKTEDEYGNVHLQFGQVSGKDGVDGQDGLDGQDGVSPIASVTKEGSVATLTVVDLEGETTVRIYDGADGQDGADFRVLGNAFATVEELNSAVTQPNEGDMYNVGENAPYSIYRWTGDEWEDQGKIQGADGFSPSVTAAKDGTVTTITMTNKDGTETVEILDGKQGIQGDPGQDGMSVTHEWEGTVLHVTSASGTTSADLKGEKGDAGTGATHSWDGTTLNITTESGTSGADLKGEQGETGQNGVVYWIDAPACLAKTTAGALYPESFNAYVYQRSGGGQAQTCASYIQLIFTGTDITSGAQGQKTLSLTSETDSFGVPIQSYFEQYMENAIPVSFTMVAYADPEKTQMRVRHTVSVVTDGAAGPNNLIYSETQPEGYVGLVWLKPVSAE